MFTINMFKRKFEPCQHRLRLSVFISDDDIDLVSFESTPEGLIQSFVTRFPPSCGVNEELEEIWDKDACHFS